MNKKVKIFSGFQGRTRIYNPQTYAINKITNKGHFHNGEEHYNLVTKSSTLAG